MNITKLSLSISLLGIIILLILTTILQPKLTTIDQITTKQLNKKIQIQGTIFNIRSFEETNFQIISIRDETGKVDITTNKILDLKNNQEILVTGRITDYKQYLQIEAEKIIITNKLTY